MIILPFCATPLSSRTYTYYPTGALKSVTEDGTTLTYTYDERGNMLRESDGTIFKNYVYNNANLRSYYQLVVGSTVCGAESYSYNILWQLQQVMFAGGLAYYTYDANGNRIGEEIIPSGVDIRTHGQFYTFDAANRVTSVRTDRYDQTNTLIEQYAEHLIYNLDGTLAQEIDRNLGTTVYTYDGAGRLTGESKGTNSTTYAYDAANNRTSMTENGVTTSYTYDANNRLLTETEGNSTKTYTYDANGNTLTAGGATYTYNARGQQTGYSTTTVSAGYTYYPTGLRKSKTVGLTTTHFVWDGQNMIYEYTGTNATGGNIYLYGLTLLSKNLTTYYLYNYHGDVVQLQTELGEIIRTYDYDAFGEETNPDATDTNAFRYAGQYFDQETGTYYLRARYYNPGIGRFTQQDGWGFSNIGDSLRLNLYTYCGGNPIKYIDLSGHYYIVKGNGGYSIRPSVEIWDEAKSWLDTLDYNGKYVTQKIETYFNIVGGTSHTTGYDDPMGALLELFDNEIQGQAIEFFAKHFPAIGPISTTYQVVKTSIDYIDKRVELYDIAHYDNVMLSLMEQSNVSTWSSKLCFLEDKISTTTKFIQTNDWYFLPTVIGYSWFDIHSSIANASDKKREKVKNKYKTLAFRYYENTFVNNLNFNYRNDYRLFYLGIEAWKFIDGVCLSYRNELWG